MYTGTWCGAPLATLLQDLAGNSGGKVLLFRPTRDVGFARHQPASFGDVGWMA